MRFCWIPGWQFSANAFSPMWQLMNGTQAQVLDYSDTPDNYDEWLNKISDTLTEPTTLVGWSLGGMLACELAHLNPLVVKVLVLNANVQFSGDLGLPTAVAHQFMHRYEQNAEVTRRRFSALVDRKHPETVAKYLLSSDQIRALKWLYDIDLSGRPLPCAVSVLLATNDALVPCEMASASWRTLGADVTVLEGEHSLPINRSQEVLQWMYLHE